MVLLIVSFCCKQETVYVVRISDWSSDVCPSVLPRVRKSITIVDAAALPLILPTGAHGLRQRIAAEFENRCLNANVVAEIDSLALLMNCVYDDIGATIKPMGAVMQEGARGRKWRCLPISDARLRRDRKSTRLNSSH